MFLKMMTSMGGPTISLTYGDEIAFGDEFPFSDAEVRRFVDAGTAELIGADDEIAAWLEANPSTAEVEAADVPAAADAQVAVANAVETDPAPAAAETPAAAAPAAPAPTVAPKPAAKKAK